MSFDNANIIFHSINQQYINSDPSVGFEYNKYINVYLYNCTDVLNMLFLQAEVNAFSNHGLLYSLVNNVVLLLNDISTNIPTYNIVTNFFNRVKPLRTNNPIQLGTVTFGVYVRSLIASYVKTASTENKNILFNAVQSIMNGSTTYPEYALIQTLNTSTSLYQTGMMSDSFIFSDTYSTFPTSQLELTNTGIVSSSRMFSSIEHTNINDFQDNELVPALFVKPFTYNSSNNSFYVNGVKAFYFK